MELHETRIAAPVEDEKLLLVNEALDALAREDPLKAEVVKLRYFVGTQASGDRRRARRQRTHRSPALGRGPGQAVRTDCPAARPAGNPG